MDFASANSFSLFDDNDDDAAKADPEFEEVLKEEGITIANVAADALIRALRLLLELLFFFFPRFRPRVRHRVVLAL